MTTCRGRRAASPCPITKKGGDPWQFCSAENRWRNTCAGTSGSAVRSSPAAASLPPWASSGWDAREEDIAYERGAIRRAESLNIAVRRFLLPADASQQELIQTLRTVNEDSSIHGCLLFRPLPPHLDTEAVTSVLAPEKDIDAITTASMGGLLTKSDIGFPPAPPPPAWNCSTTMISP